MASADTKTVTLFKTLPQPDGKHEDPHQIFALDMTQVHNFVIRAMNTMLVHAPKIDPSDKREVKAFAYYCQCWGELLHGHHHYEETEWFPMFEEKLGKGALSANVDQHHEFEADLHEFNVFSKDVLAGKEPFTAEGFTSRIYKFAPPLVRHLNDEIATLDWRILKEKLTLEDCKALMDSAIAHAQAHFTFDALAMAYCNINRGRVPWFPLLPKPFELFIQHVWWWKSRNSWKFGASDVYGNLKPEYEAYENEEKA